MMKVMLKTCLFCLQQLLFFFLITNSAIGIRICAITAGINKYKSIIKKKKKKHDKIVVLGKDKLNIIEVLISNSLIDSYMSHDEFVSINNVLREYNEM